MPGRGRFKSCHPDPGTSQDIGDRANPSGSPRLVVRGRLPLLGHSSGIPAVWFGTSHRQKRERRLTRKEVGCQASEELWVLDREGVRCCRYDSQLSLGQGFVQ